LIWTPAFTIGALATRIFGAEFVSQDLSSLNKSKAAWEKVAKDPVDGFSAKRSKERDRVERFRASIVLDSFHIFIDEIQSLVSNASLLSLGFLGILSFLGFLDFVGFLGLLGFLGFLGFLAVAVAATVAGAVAVAVF